MTRVLVVDDDPDLRLLAGYALERDGFDAELCPDGATAIDRLTRHPRPDMVLLDVQMPGIDGWTVLADIRGSPVWHTIPVVMLTVKAGPDDERRAWELGCDGYITKPYSVLDLGRHVGDILRRSPRERHEHRTRQIDVIDRVRASGDDDPALVPRPGGGR